MGWQYDEGGNTEVPSPTEIAAIQSQMLRLEVDRQHLNALGQSLFRQGETNPVEILTLGQTKLMVTSPDPRGGLYGKYVYIPVWSATALLHEERIDVCRLVTSKETDLWFEITPFQQFLEQQPREELLTLVAKQ